MKAARTPPEDRAKKMKRKIALLPFSLLFWAITGTAQASTVTYALTLSNTSSSGLIDGPTYATVSIADSGTPGSVIFTVAPNMSVLTPGTGTFGISSFGFNSTMNLSSATYFFGTGTSSNAKWRTAGSGREDGFGLFQYRVDTKSNKYAQNPLTFTISGIAGLTATDFAVASTGTATAGEGNVDFAAHVVNYSVNGTTNTGYVGGPAPVPLPGAVWLFGSGLMGLVGIARRRTRI